MNINEEKILRKYNNLFAQRDLLQELLNNREKAVEYLKGKLCTVNMKIKKMETKFKQ